jgi:large subunit ribosomal protein L35Ae
MVGQSYRLYSKGRILGYKRGKRNQRPDTSLIQLEGVANKEEAGFYLGKVSIAASGVRRARRTSEAAATWAAPITIPTATCGLTPRCHRRRVASSPSTSMTTVPVLLGPAC